MTDDNNLTKYIGKKMRITTTVGSQAFHYQGQIIGLNKSHITINDDKEGIVDIPIGNALIRKYKPIGE